MSWANEFYDDNFAELFLENNSVLGEEIDFIKDKVNFKENMRILDQGCGIGRLSGQIFDAGFNVTGLDIVPGYIAKAKDKYSNIEFICANAEEYISSNKFDAVINWWTSFGYGESKENDFAVLKSTYDNLNEEGVYILDLPNADLCLNEYSNDDKVRHEEVTDGTKLIWEGWLSEDKQKIIKKWSFKKPDGELYSKTGGGIWLYSTKEIKGMLKKCGFKSIEFYGDINSNPLKKSDRRSLVIARKTKPNFKALSNIPSNNQEFRSSIYNGDLYKINPTDSSQALAIKLQKEIYKIFGEQALYIREIGDDIGSFLKFDPLKRELEKNPEYRLIIKDLLVELGLNPSEYLVDFPRLRISIPEGYKNKKDKIAYVSHRDTWYSNSQSQINFWIPVYDCNDKNSLAFYPDYFDKAVKNNSKNFKYDEWIKAGYVEALTELSDSVSFNCNAGDIIAFSAAHMHQGLPHEEDRTRYSIDFRIVHIKDDEQNIGVPNVDNDSSSDATSDYRGYV